jgi:hypothetical protein
MKHYKIFFWYKMLKWKNNLNTMLERKSKYANRIIYAMDNYHYYLMARVWNLMVLWTRLGRREYLLFRFIIWSCRRIRCLLFLWCWCWCCLLSPYLSGLCSRIWLCSFFINRLFNLLILSVPFIPVVFIPCYWVICPSILQGLVCLTAESTSLPIAVLLGLLTIKVTANLSF